MRVESSQRVIQITRHFHYLGDRKTLVLIYVQNENICIFHWSTLNKELIGRPPRRRHTQTFNWWNVGKYKVSLISHELPEMQKSCIIYKYVKCVKKNTHCNQVLHIKIGILQNHWYKYCVDQNLNTALIINNKILIDGSFKNEPSITHHLSLPEVHVLTESVFMKRLHVTWPFWAPKMFSIATKNGMIFSSVIVEALCPNFCFWKN